MSKYTPSSRNRTLTLTEDEISSYTSRCLTSVKNMSVDDVCCKTFLGDLFDIAPCLPDSFVDLLIVDPPYNITKTFGKNTFKKSKPDAYRDFTEKWLDSIQHTLKPNCSVYVCCDWYSSLIIGDILSRRFIIQNRITWQREKGRGSMSNWKNSCEDIWFATVSKNYTFNPDKVKLRRKVIAPYKENGKPKDWSENENGKFRDTFSSNFWDDISVPFWSMAENTAHPTQKPEKLIAKLMLASSNENDFVLDPFMGSGTVPCVAKKLARRYLGIEREKIYCALAEKRIECASVNSRIQGYEDNVFWERNSTPMIRTTERTIK